MKTNNNDEILSHLCEQELENDLYYSPSNLKVKTIILPIKPEYAGKIFAGEKTYEYRTRVPKEDIKKVIFYVTDPIKKILGEAEVLGILKLPPDNLWQVTQNKSGITKDFFKTYFKDRPIAYAYKLGRITVYNASLNLIDLGVKKAPQSFLYLKNKGE